MNDKFVMEEIAKNAVAVAEKELKKIPEYEMLSDEAKVLCLVFASTSIVAQTEKFVKEHLGEFCERIFGK